MSLVILKFTAWTSTCWYFIFINPVFFRKIVPVVKISWPKKKKKWKTATSKFDSKNRFFVILYEENNYCVNDEKVDELKTKNNMLKTRDSIRSNGMFLSAQIYQDHMNNISLWTDICISERYLCKCNSTCWTSSSNQNNTNCIFSRGNFPFR